MGLTVRNNVEDHRFTISWLQCLNRQLIITVIVSRSKLPLCAANYISARGDDIGHLLRIAMMISFFLFLRRRRRPASSHVSLVGRRRRQNCDLICAAEKTASRKLRQFDCSNYRQRRNSGRRNATVRADPVARRIAGRR